MATWTHGKVLLIGTGLERDRAPGQKSSDTILTVRYFTHLNHDFSEDFCFNLRQRFAGYLHSTGLKKYTKLI